MVAVSSGSQREDKTGILPSNKVSFCTIITWKYHWTTVVMMVEWKFLSTFQSAQTHTLYSYQEAIMMEKVFSGHRICGYPGCNKLCYVERGTGRVHDYCNRTHADQHKVMRDRVWRQHGEKQQQQYHGGSHQSTRSKSGEILASLHSKEHKSSKNHQLSRYSMTITLLKNDYKSCILWYHLFEWIVVDSL